MNKKFINEYDILNYIYKNAEMGIIGINCVIEKVNNNKFIKLLKKEKKQYMEICNEAKDLLNKNGRNEESANTMAKVGTKLMSEFTLLKDSSEEMIAKMMIEGTNKGIIAIVEKINAYNGNDASVKALANKLKNTLEMNIEELKKYL